MLNNDKINWFLAHGFVSTKLTDDTVTLQKVFDNGDILEVEFDTDGNVESELFVRVGNNLYDSITL